ncbi:MAG: NAD(P)/FAD-dependent oxidoreductase [Promethearchaeota archaeon]
MIYDIIVIGGGVIGCCIARTLSKYDLSICLLEREADIAGGTTKANSGVVHAGYGAPREHTRRQFCIKGNKLYTQAAEELNFPFQRIGSFVVAVEDNQIKFLEEERKRGIEDGIPGLELILDKERIKYMEPNITDDVIGVLHAPTAGIVSPYEMTFALAENAAINGVKFFRNAKVKKISHQDYLFKLKTKSGEFQGRNVINAAGVYAAKISKMVGLDYFEIMPRKGEYILFDRNAMHLNKVLFPIPTKVSKGILVCPTIHGNTFVGPNAQNITDKKDISTTEAGLKEIIDGGRQLVPNLPLRASIKNFAGLRAVPDTYDFIIDNTDVYGFINVAGILSPGLTSCYAIAERVEEYLELLGVELKIKDEYNPNRPKPERFKNFSKEQLDEKIKEDPAWAKIICRCEMIPEKEIIDAIHSPVGAKTVDGIKFRCRPGMGRCGGGFCRPRVIEILSRELGLTYQEVTKRGEDTYFLIGKTKDLQLRKIEKGVKE